MYPGLPAQTSDKTTKTNGNNQSTGFILDKLPATKYPTYLVPMEFNEQMKLKNMIFSIAWRPRDENEEADALTNEVFTNFDPSLRVPLQWNKLEFLVLPHLTEMAEAHFKALQESEADARRSVAKSPTKEKTEREKSRPQVAGNCSDCWPQMEK